MKKIFLYLTIAACFIACKKKNEDVPAPLEPYSLAGYLKQTGFDQTVFDFVGGAEIFERGIVFEPLVDLTLSRFYLKLPAIAPNFKIILWNATTMQPITSYTNTHTDANVAFTYTPNILISLQKNQKYCLSIALTTGIYKRKRTDATDVTYPINFTNLKILSHNEIRLSNINLRAYPTNTVPASYYGDLSFEYQ